MAVLSSSERAIVWSEIMSDLSSDSENVSITKQQLRTVINNLDAGLEDFLAAMSHSGISGAAAIQVVAKLVGRRLA